MKGKKCFGLLFLLAIIFGLSLNVSSNVSALNYPINSLSIGPTTYQFRKLTDSDTGNDFYGVFYKHNYLVIESSDGVVDFPSGFSYPHTWTYTGSLDTSINSCSMPGITAEHSDWYYSDGVSRIDYSNNIFYQYRVPQIFEGYFSFFDGYNLLDPIDSPFDLNQSLYSQLPSSSSYFPSLALCYIRNWNYSNITDSVNPYPSFPTWNFSSLSNIPLVNNRLDYMKSKPFTYQFDTLYLRGSDRGDDGLIYSKNGLKMSEIFNTKIPNFHLLSFSFNDFTESQNWLSPDDINDPDDPSTERVYNFTIKGSIKFDSDYTLGSGAYTSLHVDNYYDDSYSIQDNTVEVLDSINNNSIYLLKRVISEIRCDMLDYHTSSGDDDNRIDFSCYYDPISQNAFSPEINFRFMDIYLEFNGDNGANYSELPFLSSTSGDYTFIDWSITTNGDDTPSGWSGSSGGTGGNISSAPGTVSSSPGGTGSDGSVDWTSSLKDLFNFTAINPFTPIFALFTNQSTCANIPTIAGMLHSEETQICPWFSAETRSIVTPVVGIVSMMLIFGFFVRWLGSRSGNFMEDSDSHEVGSIRVGRKGRK